MQAIQWMTALALPFLIMAGWLYLVRVQARLFPALRGKRICLLIAHPDDEAMFFAPTVLALTHPSLGNHVRVLCLSCGNADGLGETRKKELVKSGVMLGLREEDDISVMDDERFQDSMRTTWEPQLISDVLSQAFVRESKAASAQPPLAIDVLVTFDRHGVSSHPNHCSLYHGALRFVSSLEKLRLDSHGPLSVTLYTLTSTSWIRKYASIMDLVATMLQMMALRNKTADPPTELLFVSSPAGFKQARSAMTEAHQSQMRWFRWGWIVLSRYMIINDLKAERAIEE